MLELDAFKLYLLRSGRRQRTAELYVACLQRLYKETNSLELPAIEKFLIALKEKGRKATYINDFIDTLHIYGRFLKIPTYQSLQYFKEEEFIKATLSDEEIDAFLNLPPPTITRKSKNGGKPIAFVFGAKDYAIYTLFFRIMAYSGMRPGEVAHLTVDSVDFGRQVFVLETTKTTPRLVPIAPGLIQPLRDHIKSLSGEYLFPAKNNGQTRQKGVINDVDWGYNFHKRLQRLGIKRKNLTPYSFRHSLATRLLENDISLPKIQKILGHRRIDTTMHYTHLTTKDIINAIHKDPLSQHDLTIEKRMLRGREVLEGLGMLVMKSEIQGEKKIVYEVILE